MCGGSVPAVGSRPAHLLSCFSRVTAGRPLRRACRSTPPSLSPPTTPWPQERELAECTFQPHASASPPPRRRQPASGAASGATTRQAASPHPPADLLEQVQALLRGDGEAPAPAAAQATGEKPAGDWRVASPAAGAVSPAPATAAPAPALGQPAAAGPDAALGRAGGVGGPSLSFADFLDQVTSELARMQAAA